jgi:hypothetical protein
MVKKKDNVQSVIYPCDGEEGCPNTFKAYTSDNANEIKRKALFQGWFYYSVGRRKTKYICPDCFKKGL